MRLLLALGMVGGVAWIAYAFVPAECQPPTEASEVFCNRVWTPALFAMAAGYLGLWQWSWVLPWPGVRRSFGIMALGAALMVVGNFAEYWLFSSWPHDGANGWLRGFLWQTVLIGWLAVLLAGFAAGLLLLLRRPSSLRRIGLGSVLVITTCFTVFVASLALGFIAVAAPLYVLAGLADPPREAAAEPA